MINNRYEAGSEMFAMHAQLLNIRTIALNPNDKKVFWAGWMAAAFGCIVKDLGPDEFGDVLNTVLDALETLTNEAEALLAEKQLRAAGAVVEEEPASVSPLLGYADRLDSVATWMDSQVTLGSDAPDLPPAPVSQFDYDLDQAASEVGQISRALRESAA